MQQIRTKTLSGKSVLLLTALIAYPLAIHLAIIRGSGLTALLIFLTPYIALTNKRPVIKARLALLILSGLLLLEQLPGNPTQLLLYLPPIAINAGLAVAFSLSLRAGETPLITRYAQLLDGPLEPVMLNYTRGVTVLWTLLFTAMMLESLLLALFSSIEVWSLFTNILNYVFVALVFIGEYLFRRLRLTETDHPSFLDFVSRIARIRTHDIRNQ